MTHDEAHEHQTDRQQQGGQQLSLTGSVALGTGVMIGAGIFALIGQVAELAGGWVPWAFLAGAVVVGFSSYSYIRYSMANPSSGGIAMLLKAAYGPGVIAGSFSLFMYVSMVLAQSLLGRTFGNYALRPFEMQDSLLWVPVLAVLAIVGAALVNVVGNRWVERSASVTAAIKIIGIAVLAIAGLFAAGVSSLGRLVSPESATPDQGWLGFLAGVTLCILAYKGFTTITNQGGDLKNPKRNLGRSIVISISLCTVLYLLITVAVTGSLSVPQIIEARDYALAEAAEPLFGAWGVGRGAHRGRRSGGHRIGTDREPVCSLQALRHAPRYGPGAGVARQARTPVVAHHRRAGDRDGGAVRPLPDRRAGGHPLSLHGHCDPLRHPPPSQGRGESEGLDPVGGHRARRRGARAVPDPQGVLGPVHVGGHSRGGGAHHPGPMGHRPTSEGGLRQRRAGE